uniref:Uncharacterized protein n=1 Tax=Rhizophora mucronata TaxID=61149 RepID=A0A2P2QVH5_RHIMU
MIDVNSEANNKRANNAPLNDLPKEF